jgi:AcrR family transcriptional regulator
MARKAAVGKRRAVAARSTSTRDVAARRGRPRSEKAQKAILDATLALLAETGISALTMEGVAARAGVGKATIYRRWSSKLPLVVEAITTLPELRSPATGTFRSDLRHIVDDLARIFRSSPLGRVLAHLAAERGSDAEVDEAVGRYVVLRRQPLVDVVRRGLAQGDLPASLDPEVLTDLLVGPIVNRVLFSRQRVDAAFIDRVIDNVLAGATQAVATQLPKTQAGC